MEEGPEGIGPALPSRDDLGIHPTPPFSELRQGFPGLGFRLGPIYLPEVLSQGRSVLPADLTQGLPHRMEHTEWPVRRKELPDSLLQARKVVGDQDPNPSDSPPPEVLKNLLPIAGAFPFGPKHPEAQDSPTPIWPDAQRQAYRLLSRCALSNRKESPIQKHGVILLRLGPLPPPLHLLGHHRNEAGNASRGVESEVDTPHEAAERARIASDHSREARRWSGKIFSPKFPIGPTLVSRSRAQCPLAFVKCILR